MANISKDDSYFDNDRNSEMGFFFWPFPNTFLLIACCKFVKCEAVIVMALDEF